MPATVAGKNIPPKRAAQSVHTSAIAAVFGFMAVLPDYS
jgi:hypothetical protein